ncbi:MAG: hypothetical protein HC915_11385 [Anaerolineae bacterium]|nr:hypothetical protein [Anaerolineae bacterium]
MSKQDTSGGPRRRQVTQQDIDRRHEHRSKAELDRLWQQRVLIGAGALAVILVLLVIGALIYDQAVLPRESLVTVNDEEVSIDSFRNRVQYDRFQLAEQARTGYENFRAAGLSREQAENQTLQLFQNQLSLLLSDVTHGQQVLNQLEQEIILEQAAEELGVEVDQAAIDAEVARLIVAFTGRSLTETPSATPSLEPSTTATPIVSPTITHTPAPTNTVTPTIQPTALGCAEGEADCPTVTPLPSSTATRTPTSTPEITQTPTPTHTPTPTLEPGQVRATVENFREDYFEGGQDRSGLNEEAIREIFRADAILTALREYVTSNEEEFPEFYVDLQETWVDSRHILIVFPQGEVVPEGDDNPYYEEALQVKAALDAGEPFAALAQAVSDDPGSGIQGGALGWSSSAGYVEGFREAVETAEIGAITEPVRSQFGYHIIQVLDRESREVAAAQLEQQRDEAFSSFVDEQRIVARIERREDWQEFIPGSPDFEALLGDILPDLTN